jgi:transcriptional regulator with XRE-family HTH domain
MKSIVGKNIKRLRVSLRLTQDNMAYELGITKSSYSKIERGETNVSIDRLSQIAKVLETDINTLVSESKKTAPKAEDPTKQYGFATKSEIEELANMIESLRAEIAALKAEVKGNKKGKK